MFTRIIFPYCLQQLEHIISNTQNAQSNHIIRASSISHMRSCICTTSLDVTHIREVQAVVRNIYYASVTQLLFAVRTVISIFVMHERMRERVETTTNVVFGRSRM
jgi:hypothetical protein